MQRFVRWMNRHPKLAVLFFALSGAAFHFGAESWRKALLVMAGALLLDVAVDLAFTKAEEEAGEID